MSLISFLAHSINCGLNVTLYLIRVPRYLYWSTSQLAGCWWLHLLHFCDINVKEGRLAPLCKIVGHGWSFPDSLRRGWQSHPQISQRDALRTGSDKHLYIKKIKEVIKTQPWGDPVDDKRTFESTPLTFACCDLSVKKSNNQHISPGLMLWIFSLCAKICSWMQLKSEEKSIKSSCTVKMWQRHVQQGADSIIHHSTRPIGELQWVEISPTVVKSSSFTIFSNVFIAREVSASWL